MVDEELQKHTLNLYAGDYAKLQQFYPDTGAAVIIRKLVRWQVSQIESKGTSVLEKDVEILL